MVGRGAEARGAVAEQAPAPLPLTPQERPGAPPVAPPAPQGQDGGRGEQRYSRLARRSGNRPQQVGLMGKALTPAQSWLGLLLVAAGFAASVLLDEVVIGVVLVAAVVMALVVRLLWQAFTEAPQDLEEVAMEDEPARCCICDGEYEPELWHASLNVHVERLDERSVINVRDAVQVGACCRLACHRELWDRLRTAFPKGLFEHAEEMMDGFSRSQN